MGSSQPVTGDTAHFGLQRFALTVVIMGRQARHGVFRFSEYVRRHAEADREQA